MCQCAFLQDADGVIATFSVRDGVWTEPESINASGDIPEFFELVAGVHPWNPIREVIAIHHYLPAFQT
jgi:hypothetical protein